MISRVNFALPFYLLLPIHISFKCFFFDFPLPRLVLVFAFQDQCCQLIWFRSHSVEFRQFFCHSYFAWNQAILQPQKLLFFATLDFVDLVDFSLHKVHKKSCKKSILGTSKCVEMADFALVKSPNLISQKIWGIEKSWNFHTVIHKSSFLPFF